MGNNRDSSANVTVNINSKEIVNRYDTKRNKALRILKSEISKDTEQYVPFRDGTLRRSVTGSLRTNEPKIVWSAVHARFLYYGNVMVGKITRRAWANKGETKETINKTLHYSQGGSYWFKKSKQSNLKNWIRVAKTLFK